MADEASEDLGMSGWPVVSAEEREAIRRLSEELMARETSPEFDQVIAEMVAEDLGTLREDLPEEFLDHDDITDEFLSREMDAESERLYGVGTPIDSDCEVPR